jgi:hypothetical protein
MSSGLRPVSGQNRFKNPEQPKKGLALGRREGNEGLFNHDWIGTVPLLINLNKCFKLV